MKSDTPADFLARNRIAFKISGSEAILDCPLCGKPGHLYLNLRTFLFHCKKCDGKGNERRLKTALGLQFDLVTANGDDLDTIATRQLAADLANARPRAEVERWRDDLQGHPLAETARAYLQGRGFTLDTCARYGLGWAAEPDGSAPSRPRRVAPSEPCGPGWITIPAFTRWTESGPDLTSAACVKLRSVPPAPRAFRRLVGGDSVLFAPNGIKPEETILIVGGELDALSCAVAGWANVISPTTGETAWADSATAQLEACEDIAIIFDSDEAGRKGAKALAEKLGARRCRIGAWPDGIKDANEALCRLGGAFDVAALVAAAKTAGVDEIVRVRDLRGEFLAELTGASPRGISSGWPALDALIGGIREGEVTLITGDTGSGKSTFASALALNLAKAGGGVFFAPFELGARRQVAKWVRQTAGAPPDSLSRGEVETALDRLECLPIWILKRYGAISIEAVKNTVGFCVARLGVKFIILDHLHFMIKEGPEERAELDGMLKALAQIAVDTRASIFVLAHPRQIPNSGEKNADNRIVQLSDLKGSAGLKQHSDNVWSVWRPRKADRAEEGVTPEFSKAIIYVLKCRDDYGREGRAAFNYSVAAATFSEAPQIFAEGPGSAAKAPAVIDPATIPEREAPRGPRRLRLTPAPNVAPHWTEREGN